MARFYRKTTDGIVECTAEDMDSEYTYVIMSKREYDAFCNRISEPELETTCEMNLVYAELESQKELNKNLKRIMRERANQKRGLIPKKQHSGYLVLSMSQWTECYYDADHQRKTADCWKTILQTPYDASLSLNAVYSDVFFDLVDHGILSDIGIDAWIGHDGEQRYQIFLNDEGISINGLFRWRFRANFRTGLWEIEIYHTKPLNVPLEMRMI